MVGVSDKGNCRSGWYSGIEMSSNRINYRGGYFMEWVMMGYIEWHDNWHKPTGWGASRTDFPEVLA